MSLSIRNFAAEAENQNGENQNVIVNGHGGAGGASDDDDSDSDIEMYIPPEPTVNRAELQGDPMAGVKAEHNNNEELLVPGPEGFIPAPEVMNGGGMDANFDDLAATEEEERHIEMELQKQREAAAANTRSVPTHETNEPMIKGDRRTFYCDLCKVELSSIQTRNDHNSGAKHIQKKLKYEEENPDEEPNRTWIKAIPNPPPAKKKEPIRVHKKIRETVDPVIGLEYIKELMPLHDSEMEPIYECTLCKLRGTTINANGIFSHIQGKVHRINVINNTRKGIKLPDDCSSTEILEQARRMAQNDEKLDEIIHTERDDENYPWPPGKAPWSLEKGGSGIHPKMERMKLNKAKMKTESKASLALRSQERGIIPSLGEVPKIQNAAEVNRYVTLAKQLLSVLDLSKTSSVQQAQLKLDTKSKKVTDSKSFQNSVRGSFGHNHQDSRTSRTRSPSSSPGRGSPVPGPSSRSRDTSSSWARREDSLRYTNTRPVSSRDQQNSSWGRSDERYGSRRESPNHRERQSGVHDNDRRRERRDRSPRDRDGRGEPSKTRDRSSIRSDSRNKSPARDSPSWMRDHHRRDGHRRSSDSWDTSRSRTSETRDRSPRGHTGGYERSSGSRTRSPRSYDRGERYEGRDGAAAFSRHDPPPRDNHVTSYQDSRASGSRERREEASYDRRFDRSPRDHRSSRDRSPRSPRDNGQKWQRYNY